MTDGGLTYTASGGETWDSVALLLYEDEKYAVRLMSANPAALLKMDGPCFLGGEVLDVPVVEIPEAEDDEGTFSATAPWRQAAREESVEETDWYAALAKRIEEAKQVELEGFVVFDCGTSALQ